MGEIPEDIRQAAQHAAFPNDEDPALVLSISLAILDERARCKRIAIVRAARAATDYNGSKTDGNKLFYRGCERAAEAIAAEIGLA